MDLAVDFGFLKSKVVFFFHYLFLYFDNTSTMRVPAHVLHLVPCAIPKDWKVSIDCKISVDCSISTSLELKIQIIYKNFENFQLNVNQNSPKLSYYYALLHSLMSNLTIKSYLWLSYPLDANSKNIQQKSKKIFWKFFCQKWARL